MRRIAVSSVVVTLVLAGCVSSGEVGKDPAGGGGGGGGGGVFPVDPSFAPARSSPEPGDVFVEAQLADRQTMLLHLVTTYPRSWGKPYEFRVELEVPVAAVEPVDVRGGSTWPDEGNLDVELDGTSDPDVFEVKVKVDGWKSWSCLFGPPWTTLPSDDRMRFATVTVRLKQPGQHRVGLGPDGDREILRTCTGERTPPAYGGLITVP